MPMPDLYHHLLTGDRVLLEALDGLRWEPLTVVFVMLSAWWMKGVAFVAVGACGDVRARRQLPVASLIAAVSVGIGSLVVALLKETIDRPRPAHADPGIDTAVGTPGSPSFPSGHTATAFAAAAVVGAFYPRLRWPLYALAALVGMSRIYLGVHFALDVVAGAILGLSIGLGIVWAVRKGRQRLTATTDVRA
jgi:membrane-associated phospholipid phosphatase